LCRISNANRSPKSVRLSANDRGTACYDSLGSELDAGVGVSHDELFVVKSRIGPEHEAARITTLQLDEQFLVFFLQAFQDVGIQDHPDVMNRILVFANNRDAKL